MKGAAGASTLRVNRAGQPLLSNAGLTENQKRTVALHEAPGDADEPLHGRAGGDELGERGAFLAAVGSQPVEHLLALPLHQREQRPPQRAVLQTQPERGVAALGQKLGALVGIVLLGEDDHRGMLRQGVQCRDHFIGGSRQQLPAYQQQVEVFPPDFLP